MIDLEERLRRNLQAEGRRLPDPDFRLLSDRVFRSSPLERQPRPFMRGWMAGAVAFVALLVSVGGVALWLGGFGDEPVEPVALDRVTVQWREVDLVGAGTNLNFVTQGDAGFVVFGDNQDQSGGYRPRVWTSGDATNWVEPNVAGFESAVVVSGLKGGDAYLAFGLAREGGTTVTTIGSPSNFPAPTVWRSGDGRTWEAETLPLPPPDERISGNTSYGISSATVHEGSTVVVGYESDETVQSEPAPDLDRILREAGAPMDQEGGLAVVIGETAEDSYLQLLDASRTVIFERSFAELGIDPAEVQTVVPTRPVVWHSPGNGSWHLVTDERWNGASMAGDVVSGPAGFLMVLDWPHRGSSLWRSPDGREWNPLDFELGEGVYVEELAGAGAGYLVAAYDAQRLRYVWFSVDGVTWQPLPDLGAAAGGAVAASDDRLAVAVSEIVSGQIGGGEAVETETTVLLSTEGRTWQRVADSAAFPTNLHVQDLAISRDALVMAVYRGGAGFQPGEPTVWTGNITSGR